MLATYVQKSLIICSFLIAAAAIAIERAIPVVVWHGMGDSYDSEGMLDFAQILAERRGVFVHNIFINESNDRKAGFFGSVDAQVEIVCTQLASIPELNGGQIDAIGFSQGGQFLRAYVQRCNAPAVRNLITFGSQHMGVSDLPACKPTDWLCWAARKLTAVGVYTSIAQSTVVQAQYYRDPVKFDDYLRSSAFLADINNEREGLENTTYALNLAGLDNFVMLMFEDDTTVSPKETAWFGSQQFPGEDLKSDNIIMIKDQDIYKRDTIGLKKLDLAGKLVFGSCPGGHMNVGTCWEDIADKYIGNSNSNKISQNDGHKIVMQ